MDVAEVANKTLQPYVGAIVARSISQVAIGQAGIIPGLTPTPEAVQSFIQAIENGVRAFLADGFQADECMSRLRDDLGVTGVSPGTAVARNLVVEITEEYDIVSARGKSRDLCAELGFAMPEQIKIATIVSELARNIVQYVGTGRIELNTVTSPRVGIEIIATDKGSGIPHIDHVLSGGYKSKTGMGVGLLGTKRLMDDFEVDSGPAGTKIVTRKYAL